MTKINEIVKSSPLLPNVYRMLRKRFFRYQRKYRDTEQVFTDIYKRNKWNGRESVSGTGSDANQTRNIVKAIPDVFNEFNISTILDIPCGDFYWMKSVALGDKEYTGADIVEELIQKNTEKYGRDRVRFQKLNLIKDKLPKVDLVICRDCLIHLSFDDIFSTLENLCSSRSEYFLTTTFIGRAENHDIATGQFRVLNLQIEPFKLPQPLKIINEGCTEGNGDFKDKSLALWRIDHIRASMTRT